MIIVRSPARINLIGEHIDYNGGMVLPAAIDSFITFEFESRNDQKCLVQSDIMSNDFSCSINQLPNKTGTWHDYIIGVLRIISKITDKHIQGFSCKMVSSIPNGAGLSSSAALSCGLAFGINILQNLQLTKEQIIQIGLETEHQYIGTQCGIMDQFAVTMGLQNNALLLNCQTQHYDTIPITLDDHQFLLVDSRVKHTLADTDYNKRRDECQEALAIIRSHGIDVNFLIDLSPEQFQPIKPQLPLTLQKRVEFVINEQYRTMMAADYLRNNQLLAFGQLMYQSHHGIQYLYEVSCKETDTLVHEARKQLSILGARQMGGGFGGCVLYLIEKKAIPLFKEQTYKMYNDTFCIEPLFYDLNICNGIHSSIINREEL